MSMRTSIADESFKRVWGGFMTHSQKDQDEAACHTHCCGLEFPGTVFEVKLMLLEGLYSF